MKDLRSTKQPLVAFLKRYHLVLFSVIVVLLLSIAVLSLNAVVNKASGTDVDVPSGNASNFDQATIDRIQQLKTSDQPNTPLDLSKGRINPFSE